MLEAEAIHILREGVAEGRNPVILFSAGTDPTVLAHLARLLSGAARVPVAPCRLDLGVRSLLAFRDAFADQHGFELVV